MFKITTIISVLVLGLSGCHSTDGHGDTTASTKSYDSNKDQVCEQAATTGSNLRKKRCMSRKVAEAVREQNQQSMRELKRNQQIGNKNKN